MLTKNDKQKIIKKFRVHDKDTGSPQVQIAILSEEIKELTSHLKQHKHDFSSRRGLLKKVGERRKLLKYLQKEDEQAFIEVTAKLKLKIGKKLQEEEEHRKRLEQEMEKKASEEEREEEEGEKIDEEEKDSKK